MDFNKIMILLNVLGSPEVTEENRKRANVLLSQELNKEEANG